MITEAKTSLADLDTLLAQSHTPVASGGATTLSQGGTRNTAGPSNASYKPVQVINNMKVIRSWLMSILDALQSTHWKEINRDRCSAGSIYSTWSAMLAMYSVVQR